MKCKFGISYQESNIRGLSKSTKINIQGNLEMDSGELDHQY